MAVKTIIDGSLLAECEMFGAIRGGMHRVAEDINKYILTNPLLDISFANTIYMRKYQTALYKYILKNYPEYADKIVSTTPYLDPQLPFTNTIVRYLTKKLSLQVFIKNIDKNDLFFSYYYPFPKNIQQSPIKKCITFLDIIPLRMSGYDSLLIERTKEIVESIVPNYSISISEYSKADLCNYDKRVNPESVYVVPLAASPILFFVNKDISEWSRVKEKYQLPDKYFLCVSSIDHRKNLPHVIKCFSKFILQENPKDLYLVLTGNTTYGSSILKELGIAEEVRKRIVLAKSIANEDLSVVYSNAMCFFFMSLYEGFGLPALEAMQCGIPVVSSNSSSLPEVMGDSGVMLPPMDEDALAEAMNNMYKSETIRNNYSAMSLQRAKEFSWERCANEYAKIFKTITAKSA